MGQNRSIKTEPNRPQKAWFDSIFSLQIWSIQFLSHIKPTMLILFIFYPKINLTDLIYTPSVRSNLENSTRLAIGRGDACQAARGVILGVIPLVIGALDDPLLDVDTMVRPPNPIIQ